MKTIQTSPAASSVLGPQSGTIRVTGLVGTSFSLCSIGTVPEGSEARQVYGGPMVPGPWAYAVTHPNVIDNYGMAADDAWTAPVFAVGEPFQIDNMPGTYAFRSPDRLRLEGDGPKLDRLS